MLALASLKCCYECAKMVRASAVGVAAHVRVPAVVGSGEELWLPLLQLGKSKCVLAHPLRAENITSQSVRLYMSRTAQKTKRSPDPSGSHVFQAEEVLAFMSSLQHEASTTHKDSSEAKSPSEPLAVEVNASWKLASHEQGASIEVSCVRASLNRIVGRF